MDFLQNVLLMWPAFIETKESVYVREEFKSHRISLVDQHGCRFIVLEHQYGCRDVMWKRSIKLGGGPGSLLIKSTPWLLQLLNIIFDFLKRRKWIQIQDKYNHLSKSLINRVIFDAKKWIHVPGYCYRKRRVAFVLVPFSLADINWNFVV